MSYPESPSVGEFAKLERAFNRVDAFGIRRAIDNLREHSLWTEIRTMRFITGAASHDEIGVKIRTVSERELSFRVTFCAPPEAAGGRAGDCTFDEFVMTADALAVFCGALREKLRESGWIVES